MSKIKIEHKRFWEDMNWGFNNYSRLMKKYPDKWVAIVNKKVTSSGENIEEVELKAEKKSGKSKDEIPVIFIESGAHIY